MPKKATPAIAVIPMAEVLSMKQADRLSAISERARSHQRTFIEMGKLRRGIEANLKAGQNITDVLVKAGLSKGTVSNTSYAAKVFDLVEAGHIPEATYDTFTFSVCLGIVRVLGPMAKARLNQGEVAALVANSTELEDDLDALYEHGMTAADRREAEAKTAAAKAAADAPAPAATPDPDSGQPTDQPDPAHSPDQSEPGQSTEAESGDQSEPGQSTEAESGDQSEPGQSTEADTAPAKKTAPDDKPTAKDALQLLDALETVLMELSDADVELVRPRIVQVACLVEPKVVQFVAASEGKPAMGKKAVAA